MHLWSRLKKDFPVYSKKFIPNPLFNILDQLHVLMTLFVQSIYNIQQVNFQDVSRIVGQLQALSIIWLNIRGNGYNEHVTPRRSLAVDWNDRGRNTESVRSRVLQGPNDSGRERVRMKFSEARSARWILFTKSICGYRFFYQMEISDEISIWEWRYVCIACAAKEKSSRCSPASWRAFFRKPKETGQPHGLNAVERLRATA